jgi:hypothetical protein
MTQSDRNVEGGCTCGHVRYRVLSNPMIVHCCHCRWCQRQTGTAFALNALIEADRVEVLQGKVDEVVVASPRGGAARSLHGVLSAKSLSGAITRCPA